jgi:hypothetical protein
MLAMEIKVLGISMGPFLYTIVEKVRRQAVQSVLRKVLSHRIQSGKKLLGVEKQVLITRFKVALTPGGSSTVHIYTQTIHRMQRTEHT